MLGLLTRNLDEPQGREGVAEVIVASYSTTLLLSNGATVSISHYLFWLESEVLPGDPSRFKPSNAAFL